MENLLSRFDELGGIETENKIARLLERIAFVFLVLMVLSAPHSIAATQTAWLLGMSAWLVRLCIRPRPPIIKTPLNIALWAFFFWTAVTSVFSYAPDISIDKLRGALLFLIFYFVLNNLRTERAAKFLAVALVFSCMASALWSPVERIYGRGVQIFGVDANGILTKGTEVNHEVYLKNKNKNLREFGEANAENASLKPLVEGDTVLEADGVKIRTPDELAAAIERNDETYLECFHLTYYFTVKVRRADLNAGAENSLGKLGVSDWKHSRDWRYSGFYGQVITYAEVLQMIASLALGLFLAVGKKRSKAGAILLFCFAAFVFALLMTFTRSPQVALVVSAIAMVVASGNRKTAFTLGAVILPLAAAGIFYVQQSRSAAFGNRGDESVGYRETVYREGFHLWTASPKNFLLGIGMDSSKRFAKEWHLFDDGKLEMSHFHSTPLQLVVERGLPSLFLWFWILWLYGRALWRGIKDSRFKVEDLENLTPFDWRRHGIILGCFGGLIGFFVSSAVNYSLGDGEVAMVFFMLMGIGVFLSENVRGER